MRRLILNHSMIHPAGMNSWRLAFALGVILSCVQAQPAEVVAYTRAPDETAPWPVQDICTVRLDGSEEKCLTSDGNSHHPVWSPDGKQIAFIHDVSLNQNSPNGELKTNTSRRPVELSVMDADGKNRRVVRRIESVIYSMAWSPDGTTLAVSAFQASGSGQRTSGAVRSIVGNKSSADSGLTARMGLFLVDLTKSDNLSFVRPNAWTPAWSPDGNQLAFTVEQPRGRWSIHTANIDGTNDVRVTDPSINSGLSAWSPNGKRIAFQRFADIKGNQVFIMDADGKNTMQLTKDPSWFCTHPSWVSDTELVVACQSVSAPCRPGASHGQPQTSCIRRLFLVSTDPDSPLRMLFDHDGATPAVAPH